MRKNIFVNSLMLSLLLSMSPTKGHAQGTGSDYALSGIICSLGLGIGAAVGNGIGAANARHVGQYESRLRYLRAPAQVRKNVAVLTGLLSVCVVGAANSAGLPDQADLRTQLLLVLPEAAVNSVMERIHEGEDAETVIHAALLANGWQPALPAAVAATDRSGRAPALVEQIDTLAGPSNFGEIGR